MLFTKNILIFISLCLLWSCGHTAMSSDEENWENYQVILPEVTINYKLPKGSQNIIRPLTRLNKTTTRTNVFSTDYDFQRASGEYGEFSVLGILNVFDPEEKEFLKITEFESNFLAKKYGEFKRKPTDTDDIVTFDGLSWYRNSQFDASKDAFWGDSYFIPLNHSYYLLLRGEYGPESRKDKEWLKKHKEIMERIVANVKILNQQQSK